MQAYSNPARSEDAHALPDVEYWHEHGQSDSAPEAPYGATEPGWYWWSCFPGCLPDSDPVGPFATEAECIADFTDGAE